MNKKKVIIISIIIITIITVLSITLSKENYTIIIEPQYIHNKVSNKVKISDKKYLITKFDKDGDEITYKKGKLKDERTSR